MTQSRFFSSATRPTTLTADPGTSGVTLAVADGTAFSALDGSYPYQVLINWGLSDQEIVLVTNRSGNSLTVTRAQDGTPGMAHAVGATVVHGVAGRDFNEANAHRNTSSGVHGLTGSVVGTTDPQSLANKTLTQPTITDYTLAGHTHGTAASSGGLVAVPAVAVFRSTTQALTANTAAIMSWDGEDYEDNVTADAMHSTSSNPTRLTAPVAAKYLLACTVQVASNASAPYLTLELLKNGNTTAVKWSTVTGTASKTNAITLVTPYKLAAGDYVEFRITSTLAQNTTAGSANTYASMTFMSA